ncbi:MAG: response regulator, partial [Candidatus Eremiobacterota bacterium]
MKEFAVPPDKAGGMEPPVRVLVLEDDDSLRKTLVDALAMQGYAATAASRGEEALGLARESSYDLVVSDIRMEGMDGLETLARIKSEQPATRSLVITGYSTEADSIRAIQLGVSDYLKKPFRLNTFVESVGKLAAQVREERRDASRTEALRRTALFALDALSRSLDLAATDSGLPGLVRLGELGLGLGRAVGIGPDGAESVKLAVLVAAARERAQDACPPFLFEGLSPVVQRILRQLEAPAGEGQAALETRLAAAVLQYGRTGRVPENGPVEPAVLARLAELIRSPETPACGPDEPDSQPHKRGLLALARALEQAGEPEGARQAFQEASESGHPRERMEALFGLSRLSRRTGQVEAAAQQLLQAVEIARALGPVAAGEACLEAGLVLWQLERPEGSGLLEEATRHLSDLKLEPLESRATLARCAARGSVAGAAWEAALGVLLQPQYAGERA